MTLISWVPGVSGAIHVTISPVPVIVPPLASYVYVKALFSGSVAEATIAIVELKTRMEDLMGAIHEVRQLRTDVARLGEKVRSL